MAVDDSSSDDITRGVRGAKQLPRNVASGFEGADEADLWELLPGSADASILVRPAANWWSIPWRRTPTTGRRRARRGRGADEGGTGILGAGHGVWIQAVTSMPCTAMDGQVVDQVGTITCS